MTRNQRAVIDPEAAATLRALRRAARRALELGIRTGTPVYVIKGKRIVDLTKPDVLVHKAPFKPHSRRRSNLKTPQD